MVSNVNKKLSNWSKPKYFGVLFAFYFLAHGGILLIPNAVYWDDWVLYQVDPEVILDTFRQLGSMFNLYGYMHNLFLYVGPWFYKILTFFLMFGAGVALENVLKKHESISIDARFLIVLLFLVLPFYWARVALIDIPYTLSYFLFYFAWAIIDKHRVIALLLFFLSFNTNSLLVFYALPFLDFYYRSVDGHVTIKSFISFCVHKLDFFFIPFFYFVIKIVFYSPSGLYEGYNEQYSLTNLTKIPFLMALEWFALKISLFPFLLAVTLFYALVRVLTDLSHARLKGNYILWIVLGVVVLAIGGAPYWILGHLPSFVGWTSRHQLLLPLGAALAISALVITLKRDSKVLLVSIFLAISVNLNINTYMDLYFDWQKQRALIVLFAEEELIRNADLVVFDDRALSLNAIGRIYASYEWNGLLATAFGNELRFGINASELESFENGNVFTRYFTEGSKYRAGAFAPGKSLKTVLVVINRNKGRLRTLFGLGQDTFVSLNVIQLSDRVIKFD